MFPFFYGEQGWRSGESARLPPLWPGFDSRSRCHMWVEFVVGSRPCSERFFSGYSGFPLSSKTNQFPNSNLIRNPRATDLSVPDCCVSPLLNKLIYFYLIYFLSFCSIGRGRDIQTHKYQSFIEKIIIIIKYTTYLPGITICCWNLPR